MWIRTGHARLVTTTIAGAMLVLSACSQLTTGNAASPATRTRPSDSVLRPSPTLSTPSSTASVEPSGASTSTASSSPASALPPLPSPGTSGGTSTGTGGHPGTIAAAALVGRLEPLPPGAQSWGDAWSANVTPTAADFVDRFYSASGKAVVLAELKTLGLTAIANRTWTAADGNQVDFVLLDFASANGASGRYAAVVQSAQSDPALSAFAIPGHNTDAQGFRTTKVGSDGLVDSRAYAHEAGSTVVVETFYFSPTTFKIADLSTWLDKQMSLVP